MFLLWGLVALAVAHFLLIPPLWRVTRGGWSWIFHLPVYAFTQFPLLPGFCAFLGLFFADWSYFSGLLTLLRARKRARAGDAGRPRLIKASGGRAAIVAAALLTLTGIYILQDLTGFDFNRFPVEETACVSLTQLDPGADLTENSEWGPFGRKNEVFRWSQFLRPASWQYLQAGWDRDLNPISLEVDAWRFPLPSLAEKYFYELAGSFGDAYWSPGEARALDQTGADRALYCRDGDNSGLWLWKGRTVVRVRYTGAADLAVFAGDFAAMTDRLP